MPEEGYPTEEELKRVAEWDRHDPKGWLEFVKSIWWAADWGWTETLEFAASGWSRLHHVSTGGWSGNESIIGAMLDNRTLWAQVWESTRRGGHYVFLVGDSVVK